MSRNIFHNLKKKTLHNKIKNSSKKETIWPFKRNSDFANNLKMWGEMELAKGWCVEKFEDLKNKANWFGEKVLQAFTFKKNKNYSSKYFIFQLIKKNFSCKLSFNFKKKRFSLRINEIQKSFYGKNFPSQKKLVEQIAKENFFSDRDFNEEKS